MTRKDYVALAAALKVTRELAFSQHYGTSQYTALDQWRADMEAVADVLAAGNSRFDRVRFYEACGQTVVK